MLQGEPNLGRVTHALPAQHIISTVIDRLQHASPLRAREIARVTVRAAQDCRNEARPVWEECMHRTRGSGDRRIVSARRPWNRVQSGAVLDMATRLSGTSSLAWCAETRSPHSEGAEECTLHQGLP
jgi:hypothetical protein